MVTLSRSLLCLVIPTLLLVFFTVRKFGLLLRCSSRSGQSCHFWIFLLFAAMPRNPISVTLKDGKVLDGVAWETSPYDIAKKIRYVGMGVASWLAPTMFVLWGCDSLSGSC